MTDPKTMVFFPEGAFGPTNNCVGIGNVLKERGHRVVFVVEESFAGTLEAKGFEEATMRLAPPPEEPEVPGQFWKDFIRETAPEFRKPTIEQLETFLRADVAGTDRRLDVRERPPGRDLRRARARRDRRGQRRGVRRDPRQRQTVGADRVLQPVRDEGRADAARLLRLPDRRHVRLEPVLAPSTTGCSATDGPCSARGSRARRHRRSRAREFM